MIDPQAEAIARRYAAAAVDAAGCDTGACAPGEAVYGLGRYDEADLAGLDGVDPLSLGCGNPVAVAELRPGQTVLDLGSGAGLDVLLSARRVGPTGRAIGLDMTPEMLELARRNAAAAGVGNAEFLLGHLEWIPLPDATVDVVISNCVLNLAADKTRVLAEIARVLRPGGRLGITDLLADERADPAEVASSAACIGPGVRPLTESRYRRLLAGAGLADVRVRPTHQTAPHITAAIVQAAKPDGA